ncbi:hypothetical protein HDU81_011147 [Chytriomyces hyalinus]|nr:hypothetical protein HDU81_011147 [Chytriomyces hyalinus]
MDKFSAVKTNAAVPANANVGLPTNANAANSNAVNANAANTTAANRNAPNANAPNTNAGVRDKNFISGNNHVAREANGKFKQQITELREEFHGIKGAMDAFESMLDAVAEDVDSRKRLLIACQEDLQS